MRDEGRRSAWATNTLPSRAFSPPLSHGVPHIFLTALLAYGAVASRLGPCEKLLPYRKLATSSVEKVWNHGMVPLHGGVRGHCIGFPGRDNYPQAGGTRPDGGIVHMEVVANGPYDDLTAVEPHPEVHGQPPGALHLITVMVQRGLHGQGRIAGPHRMIFMGNGRPEQGHDPITHDLIDGPLVAMHGGHHPFQHRIKQLPGVLGIAVRQEFHGAFEVGKQHGHLLPLAFEGTAGGENFLRQIDLLYAPLLTPVASRNLLLYQSLLNSI